MPYSRFIITFFSVFVTFCGFSSPAHAVRVKNRDDISHQLAVSSTPGDRRVLELRPGEIYTTYSPTVTLQLLTGEHPSTQTARYLDEFVIWPDGKMHIQKYRWPGHRSFGF